MGVVLSPEGADEDSVQYRPLSVCSEEVRREGGRVGGTDQCYYVVHAL